MVSVNYIILPCYGHVQAFELTRQASSIFPNYLGEYIWC